MVSITSEKKKEVSKGEHVNLFCSATGVGADDFVYQWFLNGLPVAGQDTSTLVIVAVSEDNTGDYKCFVRNQYNGIGHSEVVTLILGKSLFSCFSIDLCIHLTDQFCNPVTVNYSGFNVIWNETQVGITVEAPCTGHNLNG